MKRNAGFTLLEIIVVVGIFLFVFTAILSVQITSNRSWQSGYNKIIEQQEARKAMEHSVQYLRLASPGNVTIQADANCTAGNKIYFNQVIYNQSSQSAELGPWVGFKANPSNCRELRRYGGDIPSQGIYVAGELESVKFNGGECSGCNCDFTNDAACANCTSVTNNCSLVKIKIVTKRPQGKAGNFTLESIVNLRNYNITSPGAAAQPEEGEF